MIKNRVVTVNFETDSPFHFDHWHARFSSQSICKSQICKSIYKLICKSQIVSQVHVIVCYILTEEDQVEVMLERLGTYGAIQVAWQNGYPGLDQPEGFVRGALYPDDGNVQMPHGVDTASFTVQVKC